MKKFFCFLALTLFSFVLFAQPWMSKLPQQKAKNELTLFDYQKAFNDYWTPFHVDKGRYVENGVTKKAIGWKQFKRWEYDMERKSDPATGKLPVLGANDLFEKYLSDNPASGLGNWTVLGPNSSGGGYAGIGRLNCIAFHPSNNNIYWVGAASGGLWVTANNGSSWSCLTDKNGVLAVSDIVIPPDYATSGTIYIATGDKDHWDNRSIGVLKSTDGGANWSATGLSYTLADGKMVNRLLMDPNNNQILVAATSGGVYKTINGGATWSIFLSALNLIDLEYKPGNFNTLYGSTTNGQIYFTADGGVTWTEAFSDGSAYRIELAVSANQSSWVYAIAVNSNSGLYGIYKSINSGASWTQVFSGSTLNMLGWDSNGGDSGGQGWYDLCLAVSPSNANTILLGGVNTWRSTNGGTSWSIVNHWWGDGVPAAHADKHSLSFRSNGDLFECNDGGIYLSTNTGTSWTDKSNGLVISQMYKLGVSQTVSNEVITGLQDNGTKLYSGGFWSDVKGGDGMECLIDYTNVNIQYGTYVNGQISRTTNHWSTEIEIQPSGAGDGAWVTPYIIDPVNPQILYAGYADVWKTTNRGDSWIQISSMNTINKIRSMAIAPSNTQVLYVADPSVIWKTTNGGSSWSNITGTLPTGSGSITSICVKNNDPNTLWITLGGYNADVVFQSSDGGATWTNISSGLPQIPAYSIVQNKQSTSQIQLYVGTELGVYFKKGTDNWTLFSNGLPNVQIGEIEIFYNAAAQNSKLRAASYGRGLWESPVYYSSTAMTYTSGNTFQNNTGTVAPGQVNQEIIGVEIVTNGDLTPLTATSFTFNTTGTTAPATDITNAKLFYTGAGNAFATTTQFGSAVIMPNGTFQITGSQVLAGGTNYFWLTYDVPVTAVLDHYLDAQCTSLTVGTAKTPVVTNPTGSRRIAVTYCNASATNCDEYIANVAVGTINNSSACSSGGYADYSTLSTAIAPGASLAITVTNGNPVYPGDRCGIWVDWNSNGILTDDPAVTVSGTPGSGPYTATITCPTGTSPGLKRMRIRIHYSDEATSPCGVAVWGEVEDYSIEVAQVCPSLNYLAVKAANYPGTYTDLGTNGTTITTANFDDANSQAINIGFTFAYNCLTFTQFILNTNGFIKLGNTPPSSAALFYTGAQTSDGGIFNSTNPADVNLISPFNHDLTSGTSAPEYRVFTSGSAPNRICTIQFRNVRDKTTSPLQQYNNIHFQIKLYETTNIIDFVYGDWTPSANASAVKTSACGLKGNSNLSNHLLVASKGSTAPWDGAVFSNSTTATLSFGNPPARPKPDAGRTYRFIPVYDNDLVVGEIHAMGEASSYYSNPQVVSVNISNSGKNTLTNIPVTLTVTGANTNTQMQTIASLSAGASALVTFNGFSAVTNGTTNISISLPNDDYNADNTKTWTQSTSNYSCNYSSAGNHSNSWGFTEGGEGIFYAKYQVTGSAKVSSVKAYIPNNSANTGQTVFGAVLNQSGVIVAQSADYVIQAADLGAWHTFNLSTQPAITDAGFYAGFGARASAIAYYPMGGQNENPCRQNTYYMSDISGNGLGVMDPSTFKNRYMIGATFTPVVINLTGSLASGQQNCYNALQTIRVAGNGTTFLVANGGSATMVAGQNIIYYSGTRVNAGGYMRGYISAANPWCEATDIPEVVMGEEPELPFAGTSACRIYPNPTTGRFTLVLNGEFDAGVISVEVYSMQGKMILAEDLAPLHPHEFSLEGKPSGLYFIRLIAGKRSETFKIIKQ